MATSFKRECVLKKDSADGCTTAEFTVIQLFTRQTAKIVKMGSEMLNG